MQKIYYVTCNSNDFCDRDNTRIYRNYTLEEVYDHQFLICDPNSDNNNIYTIKCL